MATRNDFEKAYIASMLFALLILSVNLYYYCHPWLQSVGATHSSLDYLMLMLRRGGVFSSPFKTKIFIALLLGLTSLVRSGKGAKTSPRILACVGGVATVLYLLPFTTYFWYFLCTVTGLGGIVWTCAMTGRLMSGFHEHGNDIRESFEQQREVIRNDWSINLPTRFFFKKKLHEGWINVINPFRGTLIVGSAGAGKSFSVFNPFIEQMIEKGYSMMLYDFKMPDLTKVVYNALERNKAMLKRKFGKCPEFYCINFKDPVKSNRCNPIAAEYLNDVIDASETARVVMEALNKGNEKKDFFWMSAQQYIGICLWYLRIYTPPGKKQGAWCDFPHLIELINQDYEKVLRIVKKHPSLGGKARVFIDALEADAQDQLQGQIASARIPLNDIASPALYYVLSGNDFNLDINDPEDPKILCIGNDPDRQQVYGAALSLFMFRIIKRVNQKGRPPSSIILDELPTVSVNGLDGLMATARSNRVAVVLGIQDVSQIVADYGDRVAKKVLNLPANVFVGASSIDTAEKYSKEFGKEFRRQESQTRSVDSESVSISYHEEEVMPVRKITSLPQGTFIGKVAVENDTPIEQPFFCGAIQIDMEEFRRKKAVEKEIPDISEFDLKLLREHLATPGLAELYLREWMQEQLRREWDRKDYSIDDFDKEIGKRMDALDSKGMKKLLEKAQPQIESMEIRKEIERNFYTIVEDIRNLIEQESQEHKDDDIPDVTIQEITGDEGMPPDVRTQEDALELNVTDLPIPQRALKVLLDNGVLKAGELAVLTREQLLKMSLMSPDSIKPIETALSQFGLRLGMNLPEYQK